MKEIANDIGFEIVYGDTDSLFLYRRGNDNNQDCGTGLFMNTEETLSKLKEECNKQLGIDVDAKTYKTAIISEKKKHYVGLTSIDEDELDIVGMEGDKNDRPKWINSIIRQTVHDVLTN